MRMEMAKCEHIYSGHQESILAGLHREFPEAILDSYIQRKEEILTNQAGVQPECGTPDNAVCAQGCVSTG